MIIAGQKYGKLTAIKFLKRDPRYHSFWLFRCDCGKLKSARVSNVENGHSTSCGCWKRERESGPKRSLVGKKYGLLTVVAWGGMMPGKNQGQASWICKCECGSETQVREPNLMRGLSKSCGCMTVKSQIKHGLSKTNFISKYRSFCQTRAVLNEVHPWKTLESFKRDTFRLYLEVDGDNHKGIILVRIDPLKPFSKSNVQWVKGRNLPYNLSMTGKKIERSRIFFTHKGKTHSQSEWAQIIGVSRERIRQVMNQGRLGQFIDQKLKLNA